MSAHEGSALHGEGIAMARRRGEVAAAGHTGDEAVIRAGLSDGAPAVRATALGALSRLGSLGLAELADGLADPDLTVRRRAAELAWRATAPPTDVVALLLEHLPTGRKGGSEDGSVVEAVCFSLGELRPEGVTVAISTVATNHSDPLCRESAVAALGAIGEADALPTILSALEDKPAVRRRAVLALVSYEGPEVDAALDRAMSDRDWQVRQAAEDLRGNRPQPS